MISESGLIEFYVYMYVLCREFYELLLGLPTMLAF